VISGIKDLLNFWNHLSPPFPLISILVKEA
jgi:hypothetical protein